MLTISQDTEEGMLEITSYRGNSGKIVTSQLEHFLGKAFPSKKWNFFRQENNHAYVKGEVFYQKDCKNNVLISPYRNNRLINVTDAFIFVDDSFIEISPISNILNAINKGKRELSSQEINYHIPKTVFERENLIEKDVEELKREIKEKYGIKPKEISMICSGRTKNGIYYVKGENGEEYVLKFRGKDKEKAELLSQIAENIPNYFPPNFRREDSLDFTFEIGNELYGLEGFIRGTPLKSKNINYFSLLGTHMGLLHNQFSDFIKNNKIAGELLNSIEEHTSESNLISLYLDLSKEELEHKPLLSRLEEIIKGKLYNNGDFFPIQLIHRDLNHSNLIWQGNNLKIIDSESIRISRRLDEFESPLLFGGNMKKPQYIENSLNAMSHRYNQSSEIPLSKEEIKTLPYLLKYALLRNFTIRKIRRGIKDETYLDEIIESLKIIGENLQ